MLTRVRLLASFLLVAASVRAAAPLLQDPAFFPTAVWCQDPANAARYRAVGINLYVALWQGPTEAQLAALAKAGMPVICEQNAVARKHLKDATIVGWMHGDEPDNAQELPGGKGYGPPVPPATIGKAYRRIKAADPSRPVLLNLGQGVAWDGWIGRGTRTNHPEDYAAYAAGCDVASFDIYPVVHEDPAVRGRLEFVPRGVTRLRRFVNDAKPVWACIETTRIGNPAVRPTPDQIRAEAWLAIIAGAKGLVYFAHQFKPTFVEAGLLADPEIAAAVTALNAQIRDLAPVLNAPDGRGAVQAVSMMYDAPVQCLVRLAGDGVYAFIGVPGPKAADFVVSLPGEYVPRHATVVGEHRTIEIVHGAFSDSLPGYGTRIYKIEDGHAPR